MDKYKKSTIVAATVLSVGLAAASFGAVHAASNNSSKDPFSGLVNSIAQKFNLNPTDVQKVFDEQKTQMEAQRAQEMQQYLADHLAQKVKDGKITQAQSDQISAKLKEVETLRTSLQGKTEQEIHTALDAKMAEIRQWATTNNIPTEYIMGGFGGHRGHMGPGRYNK